LKEQTITLIETSKTESILITSYHTAERYVPEEHYNTTEKQVHNARSNPMNKIIENNYI
jgi:hypothetical protein